MLPNSSILIGQKLVENAKNKNSSATFGAIFKQCEIVGVLILVFFCVDRCLRRHEPMGRQTSSSLLSVRCNGSFASLVMRQPVVDKQMRW